MIKNKVKSLDYLLRHLKKVASWCSQTFSTTLVGALPFFLLQSYDSLDFWKSLGYYGAYLLGIAAIFGKFRLQGS